MSAALVRKGLELFSDDIKPARPRKTSKKQKETLEMLSTNRKGVKKQRKRLIRVRSNKHMPTVKDKKVKSAIAYRKKPTDGNLERNLEYMMKQSTHLDDPDTYTKILSHHKGRLSKDREVVMETEEDSTIFDESDFKKFEKEYKIVKRGVNR